MLAPGGIFLILDSEHLTILGIRFYTRGREIVEKLIDGGLVLVPSGPGLSDDLPRKPVYRDAVMRADVVIPDSGLMVLLWNVLNLNRSHVRIARYSGLKLLWDMLPRPEVQAEGASYWIMPDRAERDRTLRWLRRSGFPRIGEDDCYLAPFYRDRLDADGGVRDAELLAVIEVRRPAYIFVNVGSGVQEQLGWHLRKNLSYKPAILCTGAAISFLTGGQAPIPPWAGRLYLGWLFRVMRNPYRFGRRYLAALKLIPLMLKYRDRLPPLRNS